MKNVLRIFRSLMPTFFVGVMLIGVVSCSKDDPKEDTDSRSVLVYISAQNSLMGNESNDIIEMLAGTSDMGANDHLVVFVDNNNNSRIYEITRNTKATTPYNLTPVYVYDKNLNSATPLVFDQILGYFFQHYQAKDYGLVLWSHGSGWINSTNRVQQRRSFAVDTSNGGTTRMLITDMAEVLRKYPKFEYILFDACFMQTIEVAYEFRDATKYIIGSPAEIPGVGAPYKQMMPALFLHDTEHKIAKDIVDAYGSYYNSETRSNGGVVLSAIKTSEFDNFVSVMAQMFDKYSFLDDSKYTNSLNYYPYEWNMSGAVFNAPDSYDIQGIMMKVLTDKNDYDSWENAFYRLSPYASIGSDWYSAYTHALMPVDKSQCGAVSIYLPLEKYKNDDYFDYYKEIEWGKLFEMK